MKPDRTVAAEAEKILNEEKNLIEILIGPEIVFLTIKAFFVFSWFLFSADIRFWSSFISSLVVSF